MSFTEKWIKRATDNNPDRVAIIHNKDAITYKEMFLLINSIVCEYKTRNIYRSPIALCMKRSTVYLINLIAVLLSDNFFVTIDPNCPQERIDKIYNDIHPRVVVFDKDTSIKAPLYSDSIRDNKWEPATKSITWKKADKDIFAIVYTSGSTGKPKGVVYKNIKVAEAIDSFVEAQGIKEFDIIGNSFPFSSAMSIFALLAAMKTSGTYVLLDIDSLFRVERLFGSLSMSKVRFWMTPVSVLKAIVKLKKYDSFKDTYVNRVLFAGEAIPIQILNDLIENNSDIVFCNHYGTTETMGLITYHDYKGEKEKSAHLPIGIPYKGVFIEKKPVSNEFLYKDRFELLIYGSLISSGYYNNNLSTNSKFVKIDGRITYKTGDIIISEENGSDYISGRTDLQVNKNGYRIELEDIENTAYEINEITDTCCVITDNQKIVMYYSGKIDENELRNRIKNKLPFYMLPDSFVYVDNMPYNDNGKIDRKKLKRD